MRKSQIEKLILRADNLRVILDAVTQITDERNSPTARMDYATHLCEETQLHRAAVEAAEIFRDVANMRTDGVLKPLILLDLTDVERAALTRLQELQDLSMTQVLQQALRVYQREVLAAHGLLEPDVGQKLSSETECGHIRQRFWFESNQFFGHVASMEGWERLRNAYPDLSDEDFLNAREATYAGTLKLEHREAHPNFGFRSEHDGERRLRDFLAQTGSTICPRL